MEVKEASTWRRRRERVWKKKGQNLAERETSGKQNMGRASLRWTQSHPR